MKIGVFGTGMVGTTIAGALVGLGDITTARGTEAWLLLWTRIYGAFGTAEFNLHIQR